MSSSTRDYENNNSSTTSGRPASSRSRIRTHLERDEPSIVYSGHERQGQQRRQQRQQQRQSYYSNSANYQPRSIRDLNSAFNLHAREITSSSVAGTAASASCVASIVSEAASDIKENLTAMILVHHWKVLAFGQLLSLLWACSGASQSTLLSQCGMSAPHLSNALIYTILVIYALLLAFIRACQGGGDESENNNTTNYKNKNKTNDSSVFFRSSIEDTTQVPIDLTEIELNILKQELVDITGSDESYDIDHVVQAIRHMIFHPDNWSLRSIVLMCRLLTSMEKGIRPASRFMPDQLLIDMIKNVILEDQNRNDRLLKHLALTLDERCQQRINVYKSLRTAAPSSFSASTSEMTIYNEKQSAGSGSAGDVALRMDQAGERPSGGDKELAQVRNILLQYTGKGSMADILAYRFGDVTRAVAVMKRDYFNKKELDQDEYGSNFTDLVRRNSNVQMTNSAMLDADDDNDGDSGAVADVETPTPSATTKRSSITSTTKTPKRLSLNTEQQEQHENKGLPESKMKTSKATRKNSKQIPSRRFLQSPSMGVSGYFHGGDVGDPDDLHLTEMADLNARQDRSQETRNNHEDDDDDDEPPQKTFLLGFIPTDSSLLCFYFLLALMNVEANLFIFYALRHSSLMSIMVIDSLAIISAMILSSVWLQHRYVRVHILGAFVCMVGIFFNIFSDYAADVEYQMTSVQKQGEDVVVESDTSQKVFGDILAAMGAILLGMGDVMMECSVRNMGGPTECIAMLGLFGLLISYIQLAIFDPQSIHRFFGSHQNEELFMDDDEHGLQCTTKARLAFLLAGSMATSFMFIGKAQYLFISEAALLNLSLLTANLWSVLFSIFGERIVPEPLFWVGFTLIIGGVFIYDMAPPPIEEIKDSEKGTDEEIRISHDDEEGGDSESSMPLSRENQLDFMTRLSLT